MSTQPPEVAENPIHVRPVAVDVFARRGLEIADPGGLLLHQGVDRPGEPFGDLRSVQGGVQDAGAGAIQDPAGSAIGSGHRPTGGGASGAIYAKFPDLVPIPRIEPRSAIFNSSTGPGRRVLHTHSPYLSGSPDQSEDRRRVIEDLANAYANALVAHADRFAELGADVASLNLVPVSAGIVSGAFADTTLDHLHPSYTFCALALALGWWRGTGAALPALTIYFFKPEVLTAATNVLAELGASR